MTKYTIDCSWEMYGHVDVEANSLEEAISKVENEAATKFPPSKGGFLIKG